MPTKAPVKKVAKKTRPKPKSDAPRIIAAKGGLTQSQLLAAVLSAMDEENWISKAAGRDFVSSFQAVILDALSEGMPVNIFGVVKLVPRFHTSGSREVFVEFGNPDSGKTKKNYEPKVSLKATILKTTKDSLPTPRKMAKAVQS